MLWKGHLKSSKQALHLANYNLISELLCLPWLLRIVKYFCLVMVKQKSFFLYVCSMCAEHLCQDSYLAEEEEAIQKMTFWKDSTRRVQNLNAVKNGALFTLLNLGPLNYTQDFKAAGSWVRPIKCLNHLSTTILCMGSDSAAAMHSNYAAKRVSSSSKYHNFVNVKAEKWLAKHPRNLFILHLAGRRKNRTSSCNNLGQKWICSPCIIIFSRAVGISQFLLYMKFPTRTW